MRMDRNVNLDGKGKYALVRLRTVTPGSEAHQHLKALDALGVLDWGLVGQQDEFFVIKLKDKYASAAIAAYADAVHQDVNKVLDDPVAYKERMQWAHDVQKLGQRAGVLSPFCKAPD